MKIDNGSSSIPELDQSELLPEETMPFPTNMVKSSSLVNTLSSDHGEMNITKSSHTTQEDLETLEITLSIVSMSMEVKTTTTTDLLSGLAILVLANHSGSTEDHSDIQDTHLEMESDSKSSQECLVEEPSNGTSILDQTNTDSESKTTIQVTADNGGHLTGELDLSELTQIEEEPYLFNSELLTTEETDTSLLLESIEETLIRR